MRFEAEARRIVRTLGLLDLHVDSLLATRLFGYDIRKRHSAGLHGQPIMWHCDLPRMREAGYRAATLGIHAWNFEYEGAWTECNRQFDIYDGLVAEGHLRRPAQPSDWLETGEAPSDNGGPGGSNSGPCVRKLQVEIRNRPSCQWPEHGWCCRSSGTGS